MTLTAVPPPTAVALDVSPPPRRGRRHLLVTTVGFGVLALLVQTTGYVRGWAGDTEMPIVLWYLGFVGLCLPFARLLLGRRAGDRDRLLGSVAFTVLLYLSWLLASPVVATAFDETLHVTTLVRLVDGDPGLTNTVLPVSPYFPGLELAASGVHWLTGLPLMACQVVVVLVSRITLTVTLFLLAQRITRSARAAGVTVLLYAASAQFYFFNAQFSYQTMALALLVASLWLLARACDAEREAGRWLTAVGACLAALVVTHHLTSWLTMAGLWALALLFRLGHDRVRARRTAIAAGTGTLLAVAWAASIAELLTGYLGPVFDNARASVLQLAELQTSRSPGTGGPAEPTPTWQLAVMGLAALVWCFALLPAAWAAVRRPADGLAPASRARLLPVGLALVYPLLLATRFAASAAEVGDRATTFVTLAMALVIGAWVVDRIDRVGLRVAVPVALVLLLGGAILGSGPDWQRVPGPYLAGAEQRSIDAETMAVAEWSGRYLPTGSRIAADVTLGRLVPTLAPVETVTSASGSVNMTEVFVSTSVERASELLAEGRTDFLLVDTRMTDETVRSGSYYEGSSFWGPEAATLDSAQLDKFAGAPGFDLLLDGPVQVYDVRGLRDEPQTFTDRPAPGVAGTWRPWQVALVGSLSLLLLAVAALRRRPRAWQPRDTAVAVMTLPALVVVGTLVPLAQGSAAKGAVMATILLASAGAVLWRTTRPAPLGRAWWPWVLPAAGLVLAVSLAVFANWHALLDHPPLPAPWSTS